MQKQKMTQTTNGVILVLNSANKKLSRDESVAATYVSQNSCPKTCPFLENGCYAELGNTGIHTKKLNQVSVGNPVDLAIAEADLIMSALTVNRNSIKFGGTPMRLHVVGDSATVAGTKILAHAAEKWVTRAGPVWTYTHGWKRVKREHWGMVSVLASCERRHELDEARAKGYAGALVVDEHRYTKALDLRTRSSKDKSKFVGGYKYLPCPNQTKGVTCTECKLCWKSDWLYETRTVITFAAHGVQREKVKESLLKVLV